MMIICTVRIKEEDYEIGTQLNSRMICLKRQDVEGNIEEFLLAKDGRQL